MNTNERDVYRIAFEGIKNESFMKIFILIR